MPRTKRTDQGTGPAAGGQAAARRRPEAIKKPRCQSVAARGIRTAGDYAQFMSDLMSDIVEDRIAPETANAACTAGANLLRVVEMEFRYGIRGKDGARQLLLTGQPLVEESLPWPRDEIAEASGAANAG